MELGPAQVSQAINPGAGGQRDGSRRKPIGASAPWHAEFREALPAGAGADLAPGWCRLACRRRFAAGAVAPLVLPSWGGLGEILTRFAAPARLPTAGFPAPKSHC